MSTTHTHVVVSYTYVLVFIIQPYLRATVTHYLRSGTNFVPFRSKLAEISHFTIPAQLHESRTDHKT